MRKQSIEGRNQFAMLTIDDLVPKDHLVRKIDAAIQFDFIYPIVESTYSTHGRPSIDPVVLIKLVFIQYLFGIRSMRQTIKDVETNVAYRWFLGYSFEDPIPHFSTFGKNYVRRFRETTLFEDIFSHILEQAVKAGFVTEDNLYIDSTHIKANANKHKFTKEMTYGQAKAYQDELEDEIQRVIESDFEGVPSPIGTNIGKETIETSALDHYIEFAKETIPYSLKGLKIALDCANGASYKSSVKAFRELGAEVFVINDNPDGTNINENCGSTHPEELMVTLY